MSPGGTLVGRRAELAAARALVEAVRGGSGATLLVSGEAGIGKSRLLAEVVDHASTAGLAVLAGRAVPGGGTYRPIAEALARPLRELPPPEPERLRPYRAALSRLAPAWVESDIESDEAAEARSGPVSDPTVVLGEAVLALLRELHGDRGCLLVLEDLHWADADTLGLVSYLADAVPGVPVLLALTARDDVPSPGIAELITRPSVTALGLTLLDADEVTALATACRAGVPLAGSELRALVERSDGLPFLVEELLDADLGTDGGPPPVPPTLAGLVAGRLAALPEAARPLLVAAAVAPGDPDWRLLGAVSGAGQGVVLDALRAATDVGLLTADDGRLRWRHALTRDAVLATLLPPERAAVAGRIARVLDERGEPGDPSAAAELFLAAAQRARATEILIGLGRRDAARGALRSADELLSRAASTGWSPGTVAAERVRVLTLLGRVPDALAVGAAALGSDGVTGDQHAELCLRLARAAVSGGRWAEAESWVEPPGGRRTLGRWCSPPTPRSERATEPGPTRWPRRRYEQRSGSRRWTAWPPSARR